MQSKSDMIYEFGKFNIFKLVKMALVQWLANSKESSIIANNGASEKMAPIFLANHNDVLWLDINDVECFWVKNGGSLLFDKQNPPLEHWIRTKSGKDFEVTEESWYKVMHGYDYTMPKSDEE